MVAGTRLSRTAEQEAGGNTGLGDNIAKKENICHISKVACFGTLQLPSS